MSKTSPPVKRSRQKQAIQKLLPKSGVITLAEIRRVRELANNGSVRVGRAPRVQGGEYGASGTLNVMGRIFNEDYNSLFDGKNGIAIFDQMYRSDAQCGAATDIITYPMRAARWKAEYPENASSSEKEIADAANEFLFENGDWPDGESWDFYLRHLLMRVPYGFGLLNPVWMFDESKGLLRWKRLAPRLPKTVERFDVNPDGSLKAVVQNVPTPGSGSYNFVSIPSDYALISVREREGDNYFGKSIYRRLYKHWFYKDDAYRIDGIRLDRYGVGVPVAKIQQGHVLDNDELNEIEMTLIALRSHERAYIIEPPLVDFRIMTPDNGTGGVSGLMESVNHHDAQIVRGVLAQFLSDHAEGLNTNRTKTLADIFLHALKAEANAIAGDVRSQLLRRWCAANFDMSDKRVPLVTVQGIGDLTAEQLGGVLQPFVAAGVITPEDGLEDVIRKLLMLPPLPEGWKRGESKPAVPAAGATGGTGPADATGNTAAQTGNKAPTTTADPNPPNVPQPIAAAQPIVITLERGDDSSATLQAIRDLAQSIADAPHAEIPPLTINLGGGRKKTIVLKRDDAGRIQETVTEEEGADGHETQ